MSQAETKFTPTADTKLADAAHKAEAASGTYYPFGVGDAQLFVPDSMSARDMLGKAQYLAIVTSEAAGTCMGDGGGGEFGAAMAGVITMNLAIVSALLESAEFRLAKEA